MLNTIQPTTNTQPTRSHSTLEATLRAALEHARRLTTMYGTSHTEVAIAWEAVEELQKAQRQPAPSPTPQTEESNFAIYCSLNPNAPECRIYDV